MERGTLTNISNLANNLYTEIEKLDSLLRRVDDYSDPLSVADFYKSLIIPTMEEARSYADSLELLVGKEYWPIPNYADLLYKI